MPPEGAEKRFSALADHMAQLAWMADETGWIFWYNRRWFDYTGTTLEEMQGWGWQAVHHPDYLDAVRAKFRLHLESGEPWEDTFPLKGADGKFRWFLSRAFPVHDEAGRISLWCGTNTDVTEQREAEDALRSTEARVKELYELTSRTDTDFTQKLDQLLRQGREWLGLETSILARTDCDAGTYTVVQINAEGETLPVGFTCPLEQTFCSETIKRGPNSPPLAVENAGAVPEWREHPAYKAFGAESYFAATIYLGEAVWGTLAFIGNHPRSEPFTAFDSDMARLMAQWVGSEIARQNAEAALRANALQQRRFVREILLSVTEGRLCLCDSLDDLPAPLRPASEAIALAPASLRLLRQRVEAEAQRLNLPDDRRQDVLTAVGEAGMNAVRHGGGGTGSVFVDADKGTIQVWIQDHGTGIREEDLHRATLEKGWSGGNSLGHGFFLMLRTADRTYLLTGAQGTTVVLEQQVTPPQPAWLTSPVT